MMNTSRGLEKAQCDTTGSHQYFMSYITKRYSTVSGFSKLLSHIFFKPINYLRIYTGLQGDLIAMSVNTDTFKLKSSMSKYNLHAQKNHFGRPRVFTIPLSKGIISYITSAQEQMHSLQNKNMFL